MNCILVLLLLSCCGGFGGDNRSDGRSGDGCGCDGDSRSGGGGRSGRGNNSSLGKGNNIRNGFPAVGSCGCQEATPFSGNDCGCGDNNQGNRSISDGNPSNWQDYPEISRRDNCDCDN